jgi:asparagine synthase (glutamine-hydrolysing)
MCGFAGVVTWDERYRTSRETLARMSAAVAHRGPDGEGMWISRVGEEISPGAAQAALAHRRLAIIDPDPRANQPFTDGRGRWIVFNGEIYNFSDLKSEISNLKPDYIWHTTSDTEVLLAAYDVWGERCVERLNGMFALAVWDEPGQRLFLARDRMGQKPLYIAYLAEDDNGRTSSVMPAGDEPGMPPPRLLAVAFASELQALLPLSYFDRTVDDSSLAGYLRLGYVPSWRTIYCGATQLAPARYVVATNRRCEGNSYFHPNVVKPSERGAHGDGDAVRITKDLVELATRRQMVSDVPIGCLLSGGIDSSIVAAAMRKTGAEVQTFSIGFEDPRYDESEYAAAVAQLLGTRHHAFRVHPTAAADLPKLAAVFGEPFADSSALPTHYLARETRKHVKVALSGDGGDELFGGYNRYRALRTSRVLDLIPAAIRKPMLAGFSGKLPSGHPKSVRSYVGRFLASAEHRMPLRYEGYVRLFPEPLIHELSTALVNPHFPIAELMDTRTKFNPVEAALQVDRITYLPGDLLTKIDRAAMLHALEVRSPFMDHELVRFTATLAAGQLVGGGAKRLLREAFANDLPSWVFKRKKMGFAVPIGEWFRGELREMLRDHLFASDSFARAHFKMPVVQRMVDEHETRRVDHSQRLYALLMLELWHESAS